MTRRVRRGEQGQTSMLEVIATLMILSLVLSFVYSSIESANRAIAGGQQRLMNLDEARTLMAVTTKDLRTATRLQAGTAAFVSAADRDVTFFANLNNTTGGPRKIRIYLDATTGLVTSIWAPDAASVAPNYTYTGAAAVRQVGRSVANTTSQPIFEFYDAAGAKLTTPLSATTLLAVSSVRVTLVVRRASTLTTRGVTLVNQVRLPNVGYQASA